MSNCEHDSRERISDSFNGSAEPLMHRRNFERKLDRAWTLRQLDHYPSAISSNDAKLVIACASIGSKRASKLCGKIGGTRHHEQRCFDIGGF
jgi:hypothetical protein